MTTRRGIRGGCRSLLAAVAVVLLIAVPTVGPPAASAAPLPFGPSPASTTITLIGVPDTSVSTVAQGTVDFDTGEFQSHINDADGLIRFAPPNFDPVDITYELTEVGNGNGVINLATGAVTYDTTLRMEFRDVIDGSAAPVADLRPCGFTIPLAMTGQYNSATGDVSLTAIEVIIYPTVDPCLDRNIKDELNSLISGPYRSATLDLQLPTYRAAPILTSLTPTFGAVGATVIATGSGFEPGATTIQFGSQVIPATDVNVTAGGRSATFVVPTGAPIGLNTVSATTDFGTTSSLNFSVRSTPPTAATSSIDFNDFPPLDLLGTADSELLTSGPLTSELVFPPGDYATLLNPIVYYPEYPLGFPITIGYSLKQISGGTGVVDAGAGTAAFDVTFEMKASMTDFVLVGPGSGVKYRYYLKMHFTGNYDPTTGAVALNADPFDIAPTLDNGPFYPEDFERTLVDGAVSGPAKTATLAFTLPAPIAPPPPTTTSTTTTSTTTPSTTTSTTATSVTTTTATTTTTAPPIPTVVVSPTTTTTSTVPGQGPATTSTLDPDTMDTTEVSYTTDTSGTGALSPPSTDQVLGAGDGYSPSSTPPTSSVGQRGLARTGLPAGILVGVGALLCLVGAGVRRTAKLRR